MMTTNSSPWIYDVFLSFRGEDTRNNFTDHLYTALIDADINTFRDDNELRRGEDIASELLRAIEKSRISLVVFSRNYADSRWCMDELVKILECRRTGRHLVFPIFFDVDPSHVRKQSGCFAEAFARHEKRFASQIGKVARWRLALTEAGNLSGWDLRNAVHGQEETFIKKIVQEISRELNNQYLFIAIYPVGIDSRVHEMDSLLGVGSKDVRIVGVCGIGGMGKTTIAKAIYNKFFLSFEYKSFLTNVREISKLPNGLVRLQEQLLYDILKTSKIKITGLDRGINVIKERLGGRKVLVVLDDVDKLDQLNALAGRHDWFGRGSRIIITTRDEHLLKQLGADKIYRVKELDDTESLELFSWHAFRTGSPIEDYVQFSKSVAGYSQGLPLALEVLGSYLFGKTISVWKSALEKLKKIPHDQIQKKLRISFDGLSDDTEKDIFLDIACFFVGMDRNYVVQILDGCGFFPEIGLSVLVERCLITISGTDKLTMHTLLRDMGREIVREESTKVPGKRSRLWLHEDAIDVLTKHTGTTTTEGLILTLPRLNYVNFDTNAFSKMDKLRLLQLNHVQINGGYEHLSKELRWLCWHGFSSEFVPNDFYQGNLVAIDMQYSNLRQVWKDSQLLHRLKFLNLNHSHCLTQSPDFSYLPNLEDLKLKDCRSLVEVHQSVGLLGRLISVNLKNCIQLKNLPSSFFQLKSVETLNLSGCSKFDKLDDDVGEMESLTTLLADNTAIRQVPFTIVRLKKLSYLSLCGCKGSPSQSLPSLLWSWVWPRKSPNSINLLPASLQGLNSLRRLYLTDCNLSDDAIPKDLGSLCSLVSLALQGNSFRSLPTSFIGLSKLQTLYLDHCTRLQAIPELPTGLTNLSAINCTSLERLPDLSKLLRLLELSLTNCQNLVQTPGLDKLKWVRIVHLERCNNIPKTYKENILKERTVTGFGGIFLPGNAIPDWFTYEDEGSSVFFQVPDQIANHDLIGLMVCVIFSSHHDNTRHENNTSIEVINYTKGVVKTSRPVTHDLVMSREDHLWQGHLSNHVFQLEANDEVEVSVDFGDNFTLKKTGVYLIYQKEESKMIEYNTSMANEDAVVAAHDDQTVIKNKRGSCEDGVGPSHNWSDDDKQPKKPRYDEPSI